MSTYQKFIFSDYAFNPTERTLVLQYALDDTLHFTETYRFDFPFTAFDPAALDVALQQLFFIAGVSYYKTFLPP